MLIFGQSVMNFLSRYVVRFNRLFCHYYAAMSVVHSSGSIFVHGQLMLKSGDLYYIPYILQSEAQIGISEIGVGVNSRKGHSSLRQYEIKMHLQVCIVCLLNIDK